MDISNVIYLFKKKFIDTIFFYSTLKSIFLGFHQSQLQAILPKKGSHFEKKNEKIIKIYVLDITGMYLTKYQNLRIGFQAYFKNIPR
jgi:hypothetical protein